MTNLFAAESSRRQHGMLHSALGPAIGRALQDPAVSDIIVNPDGALRIERLGSGMAATGVVLLPAEVDRIIRLVASQAGMEIGPDRPVLSAELPAGLSNIAGARIEALLPPVAPAPCFAIRKPAVRRYGLADYVRDAAMTLSEAAYLSRAVRERRNILICGGTGSGKTTLANALLAEIAADQERVVLIEDTRELECHFADMVALRARPGVSSLRDLVRSTLRLRPDRIIVGEVRGAEALDLLKAWNTGHPGGIATMHANSASAALFRLEQLVQEAIPQVPRSLIAEAIDVIVFLSGNSLGRRVETIAALNGLSADGHYRLVRMAIETSANPRSLPC
jgi:P-type conjugative transfer ATPase TrbB